MNKAIVFWFGILGALLFVTASILGGWQIEGYSFIRQYISESYASGLPNTQYLRNMFIGSGVLLTLFGFMATVVLPSSKGVKIGFVLFGLFYGLGTVTTGFFPCDIGCPSDIENASIAQLIHNAAGFLTYAIIPFCLLGIGIASRKWGASLPISMYSLVCGVIALVFVVLLFGNPTGSLIGLFQRIIEASILFWVIRTAWLLKNSDLKTLNL